MDLAQHRRCPDCAGYNRQTITPCHVTSSRNHTCDGFVVEAGIGSKTTNASPICTRRWISGSAVQFRPHLLLIQRLLDSIRRCRGSHMKGFDFLAGIAVVSLLFLVGSAAHAEVASIYGGRDGLCGHKTASGERLNCTAMTAAHRRYAFGTHVRVCHSGCVTVRINDRGPWVRGRDIDLSPAAARAIGLYTTGHVTMAVGL
jgi:hypothetical protein